MTGPRSAPSGGESTLTLRVLGSGSAFSRRYGTTCSVLTLPGGHRWLIDCGRQAPDQLHRAGLDWHDVSGQLVTHVHGDHVYGLEEFAFGRYYLASGGRRPVVRGGARPVLVAHSAVLAELWEVLGPSLRYRSGADGRPTAGVLADYFDVIGPSNVEAPRAHTWNHAETFAAPGLDLVCRETRHVHGKPSTSLEISLPGSSGAIAWWSGDSVVNSDLLERLAPRTSIFFHDCTFTEFPSQVHGLFSDFERLDESLRRKIVLMHHEDDIETYRDRAESLGFRLCMPGDVYDLSSGQRLSSEA